MDFMRTSMRLALAVVSAVPTGPALALRRYIGRKCCKNFAITRTALRRAPWHVKMHALRTTSNCQGHRHPERDAVPESTRRTADAPAPETQQQVAADHPSEVRKMRNALLRAGHAEEQLQNCIHHDEHARRHGNRRE